VSRDDLLELVRTRCWLEEVAIRESIASRSVAWEEGVLLAFHRLTRFPRPPGCSDYTLDAEWERLHFDFHKAMVSGCGSRRLVAYCEELFDKSERYRRLAAPGVPARNELEEHRGLMEACIEGDTARVVRLLQEHYGRTVDVILASGNAYLAEDGEASPGPEQAPVRSAP
jgi:DNA-binding GntR family transcriptional regulator